MSDDSCCVCSYNLDQCRWEHLKESIGCDVYVPPEDNKCDPYWKGFTDFSGVLDRAEEKALRDKLSARNRRV